MDAPLTARDAVEAILAELRRRARLRKLVAQAGYAPDEVMWVRQSEVSRAVAALVPDDSPKKVADELRQFLRVEGWREKKNSAGIWVWRAKLVKRRR